MRPRAATDRSGDDAGVAASSRPHIEISSAWISALKRFLDIVLSIFALLILFPVFLVTALLIAASDGFPVAFKQRRIGKGGEPFDIHKFRSMVRNAEEVLRSRPIC